MSHTPGPWKFKVVDETDSFLGCKRLHELVDLVQSTIGKLLEENYRERIVAVINRGYGAKHK